MRKERISASVVSDLFIYEPDTGHLRWKNAAGMGGRIKAGTIAGSIHTDQDGYKSRHVSIQGKQYIGSHLAWAWMTGEWPKNTIDHKNLNSLDDSWNNLREANNSQQKRNNRKRKDNKTGYKCVTRYEDPRYRDGKHYRWLVTVNGKRIQSSERFLTAQEAYTAYCARLPALHGQFSNTGDN